MKILKRGNSAKPWSARVACPNCKSILRVEEADLTKHHTSWRNEDFDWIYFICAACSKSLGWNNENILDKAVVDRIKKGPPPPGGIDTPILHLTGPSDPNPRYMGQFPQEDVKE